MASSDWRSATLYDVGHGIVDRTYMILAATFVTVLVLTNVIGAKLFVFPGRALTGGLIDDHTLTAGIITYPLTFLLTDVVSEIFGKRRADFMVFTGFGMSIVMLAIVQTSIVLPPSPFWTSPVPGFDDPARLQDAWVATFGIGFWLVAGSMLAYMAAQLCDNWLFHFWRGVTKGRHLWLRNNLSTPVSQLVDTFIVNSFLFYGGMRMPFVEGLRIMAVIYLFKLTIAFLDTPLCYLGVHGLRSFFHRRGVFETEDVEPAT